MLSSSETSFARQHRIPLFCTVTLLFWFSMYTCVPILAAYVEHLGASHKMAGIIVGAYGFSQMLLRIPVGVLSDRFHKRRIFINFGIAFSILSGLGLVVTQDLTLILLMRALAGAAAATWVDFTILFTSYYKHNESTKAIGTISFYNSLGQMFGILSGGWMADHMGWSASFWIGSLVGAIGLAGSFYLVEKYEQSAQPITMQGVLKVAGDRTLLIVSGLAILSQMLSFATVFGFTPVYAQSLGATKLDMGLLTFFSSLPVALASLVGGRMLAGRLGERRIVVWGFVLTGVFTATIPFFTQLWVLIVTQAIAGFGRGLSFPVLMSQSIKHMPADKRTTAMGFFQSIYGLGMFIGPVFMGMIGDWFDLRQGFVLLGAIGLATALLSHYLIRGERKPSTSAGPTSASA